MKEEQIPIIDRYLRQAVFIAFGGKCFYTGRDIKIEDMHIDHIFPKKLGGLDCISNYVLTCQEINLKKNGKYNEKFGKVVSEIVDLVYADEVRRVLKDLRANTDGLYMITEYITKRKIDENFKNRFRCRVLNSKGIHRVVRSQKKIYFREDDLSKIARDLGLTHSQHRE